MLSRPRDGPAPRAASVAPNVSETWLARTRTSPARPCLRRRAALARRHGRRLCRDVPVAPSHLVAEDGGELRERPRAPNIADAWQGASGQGRGRHDQRWWADLLRGLPESGRGLTSRARACELLRAVFAEVVSHDLLAASPCKLLVAVKPNPRPQVTVDQVGLLVEGIPERWPAGVLLAATTGLRFARACWSRPPRARPAGAPPSRAAAPSLRSRTRRQQWAVGGPGEPSKPPPAPRSCDSNRPHPPRGRAARGLPVPPAHGHLATATGVNRRSAWQARRSPVGALPAARYNLRYVTSALNGRAFLRRDPDAFVRRRYRRRALQSLKVRPRCIGIARGCRGAA